MFNWLIFKHKGPIVFFVFRREVKDLSWGRQSTVNGNTVISVTYI